MSDLQQQFANSKISKINSAADINARLQKMWNDAYNSGKVRDYSSWNYSLDALWEEVISPIEQKDKKEAQELQDEMDKINIDINKLNNGLIIPKSRFDDKPKDYYINLAKQYLALRKKSRLVKRVQHKAGMGIAHYSDDDDDID